MASYKGQDFSFNMDAAFQKAMIANKNRRDAEAAAASASPGSMEHAISSDTASRYSAEAKDADRESQAELRRRYSNQQPPRLR